MKGLRGIFGKTAPAAGARDAPTSPATASEWFEQGTALFDAGEFEAAADALRESVRLDPRLAAAYCNLGLALIELGERGQAREMLARAVELEPANPDFVTNLRIASAHPLPLWHFSMMNDAPRNDAYDAGIRSAVTPGATVFEIGTGSGLLAMMAARAGAAHVFTCEVVEALAEKASEIIAANGYAESVTVLQKHSTEVSVPEDIPARATVLVSEIISSDLLGEGLLPSLEDAKARLLEPGARVVPCAAGVRGQLVEATGLDRFVSVATVSGFDLGGFNDFSPLKVHPGEVEMAVRALSQPFDVFSFDFESHDRFPSQRTVIAVDVNQAGHCAGVLQWIRLDLGGGALYENDPKDLRRAGHWQQVLHLFAAPVLLEAGMRVRLFAGHNRNNLIFHLESPAKVGAI